MAIHIEYETELSLGFDVEPVITKVIDKALEIHQCPYAAEVMRPSAAGAQGIVAAGGKASAALWMHQSAYDGDAPGQPVRQDRQFRLSGRTGDRSFCNYTAIRL